MLVREEVERAVALQARSYQVLLWLEKALREGFIAPRTAHLYATMEDSARAWIEQHYLNLPKAARPEREDLPAFSRLFATYLTNTFDFEESPGMRLYSPDAHCFCECCCWMVRVPHLTPKKVGAADKKIAENMKRLYLRKLALGAQLTDAEGAIDALLQDPESREAVGLATYAVDLLQRLEGVSVGPASLALWRSFAWTPQGSPKKGFVLSTDAILRSEQRLLERLVASASG